MKLYLKGKPPRVINLKDVDDDMQTKYLRTVGNSFEFKATVEGTGIVEGVMRYHPFLYNKETFPVDTNPNNSKGKNNTATHILILILILYWYVMQHSVIWPVNKLLICTCKLVSCYRRWAGWGWRCDLRQYQARQRQTSNIWVLLEWPADPLHSYWWVWQLY